MKIAGQMKALVFLDTGSHLNLGGRKWAARFTADYKGQNIWTMADKEQEDAQLMEEMSEFYRRKSPKSGSKPKIEDHIARVSINIPDKAATSFCCQVTLEKNVTIYENQGVTVTVLIKDERIQKDGLYALEVDELLWN